MKLEHSRLRSLNLSEVYHVRDTDAMTKAEIERVADVFTALDVRQALSAMYFGRWRGDHDHEIWAAIQDARKAVERLVRAMMRREKRSFATAEDDVVDADVAAA